MSKERIERRTYRKSPGRYYGSDYDLSRGQGRGGHPEAAGSGEGRRSEWSEEYNSRSLSRAPDSNPVLTQRPNLRRTRQLMRKSIIANKSSRGLIEEDEDEMYADEGQDRTLYSSRYLARERSRRPSQALRRQYPETSTQEDTEFAEDEEWPQEEQDLNYIDPDQGYEEPGYDESEYDEQGLAYEDGEDERIGSAGVLPARMSARRYTSRRLVEREAPPYEEDEEEFIEEEPRRRKKRLTRRKLLVGAGAVAVGGGVIAAVELGPKIPQALNNAGSNIEHQIADAFNRGFQAGANAVRKDFINALDNMEGVSLDAAMGAAKLLRSAYDVFVNPLLTLAANVAGDFLQGTLRAFIQARHWLANIGQDNSTLASLQTVLESWTKDVKQMPKQLQAITDADLDGAQAYLRGVQRKIQAEQAKLNAQQQTTPTAAPTKKPTSGH